MYNRRALDGYNNTNKSKLILDDDLATVGTNTPIVTIKGLILVEEIYKSNKAVKVLNIKGEWRLAKFKRLKNISLYTLFFRNNKKDIIKFNVIRNQKWKLTNERIITTNDLLNENTYNNYKIKNVIPYNKVNTVNKITSWEYIGSLPFRGNSEIFILDSDSTSGFCIYDGLYIGI